MSSNCIFHGHYGTGKTSIARILIGKYSGNSAFLEINSSLYTSIDVLRSDIESFCKTKPMMDSDSDIKYILLDEFERVSIQYQDAFKGFIEKYHKNVRFILTTNHINKITPGIRSRFTEICFDAQDAKEEKFIKMEIYKKINNVILPEEGSEIPKEDLVSLINKKFPDFRGIMVGVQDYISSGGSSLIGNKNISNKTKLDLFNFLYSEVDYEKTYHFLMDTFGPEKIDVMIGLLGQPLVEWIISNKQDDISKMFEVNYIIADYSSKLDSNTTDPLILGMTIVGKIREVLN
jgi:DNA polymerase III delta prime subunit